MRVGILLMFSLLSLNAWGWQSAEEAINEFLKYELTGGRLDGANWKTYVSKYIFAPVGYDEPGFDMVTVVKSYAVGPIQCKNDQCYSVISFELTKTQVTSGQIFQHPYGGVEKLEVIPVKILGDWRLKPIKGNPHISEATYAKLK